MLATDMKPMMEDAVAEVLEAMCFISSEGPTDEDAGHFAADWIFSELDFVGHPSGTFGIAVPPATAAMAAANFLGDDEADLSETQIAEVVCELANMICGSLLSHLDNQKAFTLSPPRHDSAGALNSGAKVRMSSTYRLDEGFIYTWLEVRES